MTEIFEFSQKSMVDTLSEKKIAKLLLISESFVCNS